MHEVRVFCLAPSLKKGSFNNFIFFSGMHSWHFYYLDWPYILPAMYGNKKDLGASLYCRETQILRDSKVGLFWGQCILFSHSEI